MANKFEQAVLQALDQPLYAERLQTVQLNLGLLCNLSCRHCHVEASPKRDEIMSWPTMSSVLRLTKTMSHIQVDLTGGAPELNPNFRHLVRALREQGHPVQVRTNLSVLHEPGQEETPEFFVDNRVTLVASMPCYLNENVDAQRGSGTYRRNVTALQKLNKLGYGQEESLPLHLVYNPGGAFLPPDQAALERAYRKELLGRFGIVFTRLLTITNMPLGRFFLDLQEQGKATNYQSLLRDNFNPETLKGLMCRHQICISWDGRLADCDFNLALGLSMANGLPDHIDQVEAEMLEGRQIVTGVHCFGCTAGCGSSCGGALVA